MRTALAAASIAAVALASHALAGFGQLSYQGTPIAMTSGTGIGNDGYYYSGGFSPQGSLLVGIKAHEYGNGNNPAGTSTVSSLSGGGSWLNIDSQGRYTALSGVAANKPSWNPNAPRWGFTWSITLDGARRPVAAKFGFGDPAKGMGIGR